LEGRVKDLFLDGGRTDYIRNNWFSSLKREFQATHSPRPTCNEASALPLTPRSIARHP
jgi:hypothetical protein